MEASRQPKHVAIIMDGNGRWAKQRLLPRLKGHQTGANAVKRAIQFCVEHGIEVLTLFALSIENFVKRPRTEVSFLLSLFSSSLESNIQALHQNNIQIKIIGDRSVFNTSLISKIEMAENQTKNNTGLKLIIAANYSGRWDILQATQKLMIDAQQNHIDPKTLKESDLEKYLCLSNLPEPDLLIRTSGELRLSNFMLWQMAYTEFCFIDELWPEFDEMAFSKAIEIFHQRQRRFGLTAEQLAEAEG